MSSAFWLVEGQRSGSAVLADPRIVVQGAGDVKNPDSSSRVFPLGVGLLGAQYFFYFLNRFRSNHWPPLASPESHVRPQEKKSARCCRFESRNDSEFIAQNSAFYRPKSLSIGQLHNT